MRAFAGAWPGTVIVQQPAVQFVRRLGAQMSPANSTIVQAPLAQMAGTASMVQAPLAQLPWYHHLTLLDKLTTTAERLWYAARAVEHGWSRTKSRRACTNARATRSRILKPRCRLRNPTSPKASRKILISLIF